MTTDSHLSKWPYFVATSYERLQVILSRVSGRSFAFRGEPKGYDTYLTASFNRLLGPIGPTTVYSKLLEIERKSIEWFQRGSYPHATVQEQLLLRDYVGTLAMMQHYGAPTRLLDWSNSAWVATYFACSGEPKADGVVYCLSLAHLQQAMHDRYPEDAAALFQPNGAAKVLEKAITADAPEWALEINTLRPFERLMAQQGLHLMCGRIGMSHGTVLESMIPLNAAGRDLSRFAVVVPASLKPQTLHSLRAMNITAASLFPGLDGIGQSVRDRVIDEEFVSDPATNQGPDLEFLRALDEFDKNS